MNYEPIQLASIALAGFLLLIGTTFWIKHQRRKRWPYQLKHSILSPAELQFFQALNRCVRDRAIICPKVGMKDFIEVDRRLAGKHYMKYIGKIAQKHVDFLLCDPETYEPICAIELNDASHQRPDVMERDYFVSKVYEAANIPLVSVIAKRRYDQQELKEALDWLF